MKNFNFGEFAKELQSTQNCQQLFPPPILKEKNPESTQLAEMKQDHKKAVTFGSPFMPNQIYYGQSDPDKENIEVGPQTNLKFKDATNGQFHINKNSSKRASSKLSKCYQPITAQALYRPMEDEATSPFSGFTEEKDHENSINAQMLQTNQRLTNRVQQSDDRNVISFTGTHIQPITFPLRHDVNGNISNLIRSDQMPDHGDNVNHLEMISMMPQSHGVQKISNSHQSEPPKNDPNQEISNLSHLKNQTSQSLNSIHGVNGDIGAKLCQNLIESVGENISDTNFGLKPWLKETISLNPRVSAEGQLVNQNQWLRELAHQMDIDEQTDENLNYEPQRKRTCLPYENSIPQNQFLSISSSTNLYFQPQVSDLSKNMRY